MVENRGNSILYTYHWIGWRHLVFYSGRCCLTVKMVYLPICIYQHNRNKSNLRRSQALAHGPKNTMTNVRYIYDHVSEINYCNKIINSFTRWNQLTPWLNKNTSKIRSSKWIQNPHSCRWFVFQYVRYYNAKWIEALLSIYGVHFEFCSFFKKKIFFKLNPMIICIDMILRYHISIFMIL